MGGAVYALVECDPEGCVTHALYASRKDALRSSLALKRRRVEEALENRILFGRKPWPDFYKTLWTTAWVSVEPYEVQ